MLGHSVTKLRAALCKTHGGFEQATEAQLLSLYESLGDDERAAIDKRIMGPTPRPRKSPAIKEANDAEVTG